MESTYQALKAALLDAGAAGGLRIATMETALRRYSALRRAAQQAVKAARILHAPPAARDSLEEAGAEP